MQARTTDILKMVRCTSCGIHWAMPEWFFAARLDDNKTFYCPNGCPRYYPPGGSKEDKLKAEVERLKNQCVRHRKEADDHRRSAAAQRGVVTKLKKRAAAGVCPCCNRTFQNLARHMKSQHPQFAEDGNGDLLRLVRQRLESDEQAGSQEESAG